MDAGLVLELITRVKQMHIYFDSLSMMDLRSQPGEVLDEVARHGRSFLIERNGQQKACLVPISLFLPDIQPSRISKELDILSEKKEKFRISIAKSKEIQLLFRELKGDETISINITLPHGYPHKAPVAFADPIDPSSPHRWNDGSLCIYGAMDIWNPGKHSVFDALELCRRWIANYAVWRNTDEWPKQREA